MSFVIEPHPVHFGVRAPERRRVEREKREEQERQKKTGQADAGDCNNKLKVDGDMGVELIDDYLNKLGHVASDEMKKSLSVTVTIHDLEEMLEAVFSKTYSEEAKQTLSKLLTQVEAISGEFIDKVISNEAEIKLGPYTAGNNKPTEQVFSGEQLKKELTNQVKGVNKPTPEHYVAVVEANTRESLT